MALPRLALLLLFQLTWKSMFRENPLTLQFQTVMSSEGPLKADIFLEAVTNTTLTYVDF